jgi:type IX secretion system PorP/SprF family membrane protein
MFNMTQINPAYAGNRATNNITSLYRKQWINVEGAPTTASLSWDKREENSNVGYGLQIYNDRIGIESTSGIQAFYSFHIPFRKSSLSMGLSGGVLNYRGEFSKANVTDANDPLFQEDVNVWLPTVGIGALYANENWYAGVSSPSILKTKVTENDAQITNNTTNHYFITSGYIFKVSEILKLKPSILLKAVKGAPLQYDFNLNTWINDIVGVGVSYRTNDAFVGMFELQVSPVFRLGYAYDYLISNLKTYSKGTHELMLRYEFDNEKKQRILSPRYY